MTRHKDLQARLEQATGAAIVPAWDPKMERAVRERRQQRMAERGHDPASGDTDLIQTRLAEARARQREEERASGLDS